MKEAWPWLALAGLGLFHGLNPAMGWLFAVALGLHRRRGGLVALALLPIGLGHAASILLVVLGVLLLGELIELTTLRLLAGASLILFALWHAAFGHRHRVRIGLGTGLAGLGVWSFLMASTHGAGLMLLPVVLPLQADAHHHGLVPAESLAVSMLAVGLHMAAMLAATGALAWVVYRWIGLAVLRRGWINFDLLWTGLLLLAGLALIASGLPLPAMF